MNATALFNDDAEGTAGHPADTPRRKVLVTGAGGAIGRHFSASAAERYDLRLMLLPGKEPRELADRGELVHADLSDPGAMAEAVAGVDTVLHLAADSSTRAKWPSLLKNNLDGLHTLYEASVEAGVRRVIFASSIHAVYAHAPGHLVRPEDAPMPGNLYGASKAFGESLGRYYAVRRGLSVINVRIGWCCPTEKVPSEPHPGLRTIWVSPRDMDQLLVRCIDDTRLRYAVVHGTSRTDLPVLELESTCALLGYDPQDHAMAPELAYRAPQDPAG
ncbi:MAG: NAD(P)-dependent oxidoreductase [Planctomycetota bacterium]